MMVRAMLILYGNYNVALLLVMMMMSLVVMMNISAILHHRKDKHSDNFYRCYCCWSKILEMSMFECSYSYFHVKARRKKKKRKEKEKKMERREGKYKHYIYTHNLFLFFNQKECTSENTTRHNLGECQTFPRARTDWYPVKKKDF